MENPPVVDQAEDEELAFIQHVAMDLGLPLHLAIAAFNQPVVINIFDEDADEVLAPLWVAALNGNVAQAVALLDQGADIEARNLSGWSALHFATMEGHLEVVALLLDRGADSEAVDIAGWSTIMFASLKNLELVQLLHARGANIHHTSGVTGENALHIAAQRDDLSVCEFLLSKGVDLMAADNDGRTALSHYGCDVDPALSLDTKALRVAALEAAWAAGPHPSQVRRRRWESRGPLLWVLAEHGYRPLQLRAQAIAAAAVGAPLPLIVHSAKEDVLRSEGLVRYIVAFL